MPGYYALQFSWVFWVFWVVSKLGIFCPPLLLIMNILFDLVVFSSTIWHKCITFTLIRQIKKEIISILFHSSCSFHDHQDPTRCMEQRIFNIIPSSSLHGVMDPSINLLHLRHRHDESLTETSPCDEISEPGPSLHYLRLFLRHIGVLLAHVLYSPKVWSWYTRIQVGLAIPPPDLEICSNAAEKLRIYW